MLPYLRCFIQIIFLIFFVSCNYMPSIFECYITSIIFEDGIDVLYLIIEAKQLGSQVVNNATTIYILT